MTHIFHMPSKDFFIEWKNGKGHFNLIHILKDHITSHDKLAEGHIPFIADSPSLARMNKDRSQSS